LSGQDAHSTAVLDYFRSFPKMMGFTEVTVIIGRAGCPPHRSSGLFLDVKINQEART
jgi:hypothetical protein